MLRNWTNPLDAATQAVAVRAQLVTCRAAINTENTNHKATLAPLKVQEQQLCQQISYLESQAGTSVI